MRKILFVLCMFLMTSCSKEDNSIKTEIVQNGTIVAQVIMISEGTNTADVEVIEQLEGDLEHNSFTISGFDITLIELYDTVEVDYSRTLNVDGRDILYVKSIKVLEEE